MPARGRLLNGQRSEKDNAELRMGCSLVRAPASSQPMVAHASRSEPRGAGRLPGATSRHMKLERRRLALACDAVWVRLLRQVFSEANIPRASGKGFAQTPAALRLATNSRMRFAFMPTSLEPIRDMERISSWLPPAAGVMRITISSLKP